MHTTAVCCVVADIFVVHWIHLSHMNNEHQVQAGGRNLDAIFD